MRIFSSPKSRIGQGPSVSGLKKPKTRNSLMVTYIHFQKMIKKFCIQDKIFLNSAALFSLLAKKSSHLT